MCSLQDEHVVEQFGDREQVRIGRRRGEPQQRFDLNGQRTLVVVIGVDTPQPLGCGSARRRHVALGLERRGEGDTGSLEQLPTLPGRGQRRQRA